MAAETVTLQLRDDAGALVRSFNVPLNKLDAAAAPAAGDDDADGYVGGSLWVDRTNDKAYVCVDNATAAAVWREIPSSPAGYTDEEAQDAVGAMAADTDTVNVTYTDATPELKWDVRTQMSVTSDASGLKLSGDAAAPGNSKYYGTDSGGAKGWFALPAGYTAENAQDDVGGILADSARVNFTYTDATPEITADLIADTITAGYLHASATDVLFGRSTAAAGPGEEIPCTAFARTLLDDANAGAARTTLGLVIGTDVLAFDAGVQQIADLADPNADRILFWDDSASAYTFLTVGTGLSVAGTTLSATGATVADGDYGDITVSGSGTVWAIDAGAVTLAKMANVATDVLLGRVSAGAGAVEEIGISDFVQTLLDDATAASARTTLGAAGRGANTDITSVQLGNEGLQVRDSDASHWLTIRCATNLTADRVFSVNPTADGLTLTIPAAASVSGTNTGDQTITLTGHVTGSGTGTFATTIPAGTVTHAMMANMATDRLVGRDTAAAGVREEITVGGGIEFTGSGGIQTSAFTGDVTKAAGGTATTIANDAVTYAKFQNASAASRVLGRGSASGAGDYEELTPAKGIAVVGTELVNVSGRWMASSYVQTDQSTSSTTLGDLATADTVTFTLTEARDVLIVYAANVYQSTVGANNRDVIDIDGADEGATQNDWTAARANAGVSVVIVYKKSLASGAHTIKAQHAAIGGGTANWRNRFLGVQLFA